MNKHVVCLFVFLLGNVTIYNTNNMIENNKDMMYDNVTLAITDKYILNIYYD